MVTIRCQNKIIGTKNGRCGRVLAILTDAMIDMLVLDPEGGPIFRCPQCHHEQRWIQITNKDKSLKFETVEQPTDLPPEPEYAELNIYEQVG